MAFDQVVWQFGIRKQPRISNRISAVSSSSRTAYTARWSRSANKLIVKPSDVEYREISWAHTTRSQPMPVVDTNALKRTVKGRNITRMNERQYISGPAKVPANCPGKTTAHFDSNLFNFKHKCYQHLSDLIPL